MNQVERRLRTAVNPLSTAFAGWWCHSAVRHLLTGHGPAARQRQLIRLQAARGPSDEAMKAHAAAIDELLARDPHHG